MRKKLGWQRLNSKMRIDCITLKKYSKKGYIVERLFAILYFMLLRKFAYPNYKYPVVVCKENYLRIEKVLDTCRRLAKANKYDFDFSVGYAKHNVLIKFADYVAAAYRKVDYKTLKQFRFYNILDNEIDRRDAYKAFRLDKK